MSVTMEFFDGITFDIAKQKYYNANKVDARMEEIKAAFAELIEENNELRRQINDVGLSKERVAELIMGAQANKGRKRKGRGDNKQSKARRRRYRCQPQGI